MREHILYDSDADYAYALDFVHLESHFHIIRAHF